MLPQEPNSSSSSSVSTVNTVIKYEAEDEVDIKLEFKEEQQEEKEDNILQLPAQFSNEPDDIQNVNGFRAKVELDELQEERVDGEDQDQDPFASLVTCDKDLITKQSNNNNNNAGKMLKCPSCDKRFSTRQKLATHKIIHRKKYFCPVCDYKALARRALNRHVKRDHSRQCPSCDKKFCTCQDLKDHQKAHHNNCTICGYKAPNQRFLKFHLHGHTNQEKPWKCPEPNSTSSFGQKQDLQSLKSHQFSIHSKNEQEHKIWGCELCSFQTTGKSQLKTHQDVVHNPARRLKCPHEHCPFQTPNKIDLKMHIQRHHFQSRRFKCPDARSGSGPNQNQMTKIKTEQEPEEAEKKKEIMQNYAQFLNEAEECTNGNDFRTKVDSDELNYELNYELQEEGVDDEDQDPDPFASLVICDKDLITKQNNNNNAEKILKCPSCDKEFSTPKKLRCHKIIHNKKFNCSLCDLKAASLSALKLHFRTHTNQGKPWKCPEPNCTSSFGQQQYLQFHQLSFHTKNEQECKIWSCELCSFQTTGKSQLKTHQDVVHNPARRLNCSHEHCPFQTPNKIDLKMHIQRHHFQSRRFKCPQAGSGSGSKPNQNQMTQIKTEQEPEEEAEAEKEKEIMQNCAQFLKETEECTNGSDFARGMEFNELDVGLKEEQKEWLDEMDQDSIINTNTKTKKFTFSPVPVPVPKPTQSNFKSDKNFPTLKKVVNHKSQNKKYKCDFCPFTTLSSTLLSVHEDSVHKWGTKFQCPNSHCSYECTSRKSLIMHFARAHQPARPFKCPQSGCIYSGIAKENLIYHLEAVHKKSREEVEVILLQNECTNEKEIEIEPELVELKYEIKEENWVDESEQNPIINPMRDEKD